MTCIAECRLFFLLVRGAMVEGNLFVSETKIGHEAMFDGFGKLDRVCGHYRQNIPGISQDASELDNHSFGPPQEMGSVPTV